MLEDDAAYGPLPVAVRVVIQLDVAAHSARFVSTVAIESRRIRAKTVLVSSCGIQCPIASVAMAIPR